MSDSSLRPCLGQGASQGEESVLADSGRAGEISAGVGRVGSLAFFSNLLKEFRFDQVQNFAGRLA